MLQLLWKNSSPVDGKIFGIKYFSKVGLYRRGYQTTVKDSESMYYLISWDEGNWGSEVPCLRTETSPWHLLLRTLWASLSCRRKRPWRLQFHSACALIYTDQHSFNYTCYIILYFTFTKSIVPFVFCFFLINLRNSIFGSKIKVSVSSPISLMASFFPQQDDGLVVALPNLSVLSQMWQTLGSSWSSSCFASGLPLHHCPCSGSPCCKQSL